MAKIETLKLWYDGEKSWDSGDKNSALFSFSQIAEPSSRILFNIGCVYLGLGSLHDAGQYFTKTTQKDPHLALAYWQRAVAQYKQKKYNNALQDFDSCHEKLRGKTLIDYTKLDLKYKLYECEILYNKAQCHLSLNNRTSAQTCLQQAQNSKVEKRHRIIDTALANIASGQPSSLIELPEDAIFRSDKTKVKHIDRQVDYIGKAKVISSVNENDTFAGFSGPRQVEEEKTKVLSAPSSPTEDRKQEKRRNTPPSPTSPLMRIKNAISPKFMRKSHGPPPDKPAPRPPASAMSDKSKSKNKSGKAVPRISVTSDSDENMSDSSKPPTPPARPKLPAGRKTSPLAEKKLPQPPADYLLDLRRGSESAVCTKTDMAVVVPPRKKSVDMLQGRALPPEKTAKEAGVTQIINKFDWKPTLPSRTKKVENGVPARPPPKAVPKSRPLPPEPSLSAPPSRPPPKPSVKGKPLPSEPQAGQERLVDVSITCHTCQRTQVPVGSSLSVMVDKASQMFDLPANSFNLWYQRSSDQELVCIISEGDMRSAWDTLTDNTLELWCYGKL